MDHQMYSSAMEWADPRFRCCCGSCHVVTGTHICLVLYVMLSLLSVIFGMKSTSTWLIVPMFVVGLAVYALLSGRHKYLYPFLIITVVQNFVCLIMALIIFSFALISFDSLRHMIGYSLDIGQNPSVTVSLLVVAGTIGVCLLVAAVHVWQAVVIYRCLQFFEEVSTGPRPVTTRWDGETFGESTSCKD